MKYFITLICGLLILNLNAQTLDICDDFEVYQNGNPIAETSSNWNSWGELMSGLTAPFADDANVTNVLSSSGSNSLYFEAVGTGGPQDIVLPFGTNAPYEIGLFEFSAMFYVNPNTGAYFNFQTDNIPGIGWSLDCRMEASGALILENTGSGLNYLNTTYTQGQWFEIKLVCDLTNNNWELFLDGISQGTFVNSENKIASLDLYPITGNQFYVDDVCWSYTAPNLENLNAQVISVSPIVGLASQTRNPLVEVRNLGINNVTSFDVDFNYNGTIITENISGVNMATLDVYQIDFTNSINLIGGLNTGTATVYNVNGLGQDDDPSDDNISIQIDAIIPAEGKLVIGEEATGTWCGWCPRGAVALNWMDKDYAGYWQGIAVHNGDPMTNPDYDNGMAGYISGYPSGIVDRGTDIDPGAFNQDFLQRIIIQPNGIIENGAELNGNTLKVSLTVDFKANISGNWKLACVLVEDSVTGTTPQYYQSNSYSGGGAGPLVDVDGTDWANLGSNVPASQMIYRHVARGIAPSFNGLLLSSNSYNDGDTETVCFEFLLDQNWNQEQIHIVGMLLDASGRIDNASSTSISTSLDQGYVSCATSVFGNNLKGPDSINIYPNPTTEKIYISNIKEKTNMKIFNIEGKQILEKNITEAIKINTNFLSPGIYQIKFENKNKTEVIKLIKE